MDHVRDQELMDAAILEKLLSGRAVNGFEAEEQYLDENLRKVSELVASPLSNEEFRNHPFIRMLFAHGSRGWEDSLV